MILNSLEQEEYKRYTDQFDFREYMQNKNFLITGSGGMTGQAIVKWILYVNKEFGINAKIYASTRRPDNVPSYIQEDDNVIMCRYGHEKSTIGDAPIDYIIHAASPTERDFFVNYPVETYRVIIEGTINMLEFCKEKNAKFILLSSVEVYGATNSDKPVGENETGAINSLNIRNGYPLGKKGAEFLSYSYCKEYGCDTRNVRISAIQGLYQPYGELRIFNEIARCIIENHNLIMKSDGKSKKSIIYTLDAVSGIFTALFKGGKGETYNLTNPETFLSMKDFAEKIFKRFNDDVGIEYHIDSETNTGYLPHLEIVQDVAKISGLGWEPITNLEKIYEIDLKRFRA